MNFYFIYYRYELDDPEFKFLKFAQNDFFIEMSARIMLWHMSKVFKWIDRKGVNYLRKNLKVFCELFETKFKSHYKDYDESVIRDFCDALISAKNDALKEGKESAPYLKVRLRVGGVRNGGLSF